MIEYGDNELAEKILINPEYPGWGFMLSKGAISVWERWELEITHLVMHSYGHPMFGSYDIWFYEGLGGIRLKDSCRGMREFVLKPAFNKDVDFVNCSLKTVNGKIESNWKRDGDSVIYEFTVPSNTNAKLLTDKLIKDLPEGIIKTENGYSCVSGKYTIKLV